MSNLPKISVIILGFNNKQITLDCIGSIMASDYPIHEIIYVDNNSSDGSGEAVKNRFPTVKIISAYKNLLYASGMNAGITFSTGDIIFCLNNDTIIHKSCIREIALAMQDQTIGCANTKILRAGTNKLDMSICRLGFMGIFPYSIDYGLEDIGQCDNLTPDYATGCAMILRKKALDKVGLFNDKFGMYWEDVDLSFRIKNAGYQVAFIPKAVVWHKGGVTVKTVPWKTKWYMNKNRVKILLKYGGRK